MGIRPILASDKAAFKRILQNFDNFLFDCDGVLCHGNVPIKGAVDVINQLDKIGKRVLFVSNNSTKTRGSYLDKLTNMGFTAKRNTIFSTAYTSAQFLKHEIQMQGKVYVVGNECMGEELKNLGIQFFGIGADNEIVSQNHTQIASLKLEDNVEAVLVGFDGHISFTKLIKAASYLRNPNCLYVATNDDDRMPMEGSKLVIPGTGCVVKSVTTAAGRSPDALCGKPDTYMFKCIQESFNLDSSRTIMIGDRMNTDILFGNRNKMKSLVVLTGVESMESLEKAITSEDPLLQEQVPNYYMSSIGDWADMFEAST